ncbi:MAG: S1/P1 nuclease [Bryobacteraceae bacterium]
MWIVRGLAWLCLGLATGWSWNGKGHMTIAYIAYQRLDPALKPTVHTLLKANPDYKKWVQNIPASNQEERLLEAFLRASIWPDDIKSKSGYTSDGTNNGNVPPVNDPRAKQNIGYKDKFRHKYWHFHDHPFSSDGTATQKAPTPSALTMIPILADGLKTSPKKTIRSYDLVWLIHLAGDVHQPLHCAARFTAQQPNGDDGGNGVKLTNRQGNEVASLHSFWDGLLGGGFTEEAASLGDDLIAEHTSPPGATITNAETWIDESFKLAQKFAYAPPIRSDGKRSFTNSTYRKDATGLAEKQAVLAGWRLANVLNDSLKP